VTFASVGTDYVLESRVDDITNTASLNSALAQRLSVESDILRGGIHQGRLVIISDAGFLRRRLVEGLTEILVVAAVLTILAGLASVFLLRSAIRPVSQLTQAIEDAVASESFANQVDTRRSDEIGRLGASFNKMMTGLIERDRMIQSHVENLEDKVEVRTRQYRLAKEDAEQANAAKSDFLATMSHEIRTPLNGMLVMAELLANGNLPGKQKRFADVIQASGQGLLTIINDILDLSKIEASKLELENIPIDLNALIENTTALFAGKARESGLSIGVYVAPETPLTLLGDPTPLSQVLTNLLNNALKFTETGGVAIYASPLLDGEGVCLRVLDTGIGIPKDRLQSIFESFSQADQSTTRKFGGTGLGLSICQKLVTAMGGETFVESEVGTGSIFSCHLPLETLNAPAPLAPLGEKSVLLLHEDTVAARLIGSQMSAHGLRVCRHNPDTAPDLLKQGFDYVIGAPGVLQKVLSSSFATSTVGVCLQQFGDTSGERALHTGLAKDLVTLPIGPTRVRQLCERLQTGELAGPSALETKSGSADALETFEGLKVLAADDNPVNREVLNEALMTLGVDAEFFEAAPPLLDRAVAAEPDTIFLDISMPGMDGVEALKRLKALPLTPEPHIIALTAHVTRESQAKMLTEGFDAVVSKPFTLAQISNVLSVSGRDVAGASRIEEEVVSCSAPLWDPSILNSLEAETGRTGFASRMVRLFRRNCLSAFEEVVRSHGGPEDGIRQSAHAFKSMATTIGATKIAKRCQDIEDNPSALDISQLKTLAEDLQQTLELLSLSSDGERQETAEMGSVRKS